MTRQTPPREGFVLIAVLFVIVLLSLAAYRYADLMSAEARASDRVLKATQARALADSGIHYAAAILSDPSAFSGTLGGNPYDNASIFKGVQVTGDGGRFSIIAVDYAQASYGGEASVRYGASDEAGKLNINALMQIDKTGTVAFGALMKLPNMTEDIANAIIDWIDTDETPRAGGAENDYYTALENPYRCKNGPLDSLEELLLIKGVTAQLLFGTDANRNGKNDDSAGSGQFDTGWYPLLTIYGRERNVDNTGTARININGKDLQALLTQLTTALGNQDLAAYIVAYRLYDTVQPNAKPSTPAAKVGASAALTTLVQKAVSGGTSKAKRSISSMSTLLGTKVSIPGTPSPGRPGQPPQPAVATEYASPLSDAGSMRELLPLMLDKLTTTADTDLPGRVNVNTAPQAVLAALPSLEDVDVQSIMALRPSPGSTGDDTTYQTPAWLVTEANLTPTKMQAIEKYVTARTQVYRVQVVGYFDNGGPMTRVEAIIDTNQGYPRIIHVRDLTELGRAFDVRDN